jgi:hypothetical protein
MANGTIAFDTLSTSGQITGTAKSVDTDYVVNGSAKYWVRFQGTGTGVRDSFNHTSITDNGTGSYSLVINNNMNNALYAIVIHESDWRTVGTENDTDQTTTKIDLTGRNPSSGAALDPVEVSLAGLGDLA